MPRSQEAAFENFKQDKWMCPAAIASANFLPSTSAGKKPLSALAPTVTETKSSPRLISIVRRRESDLCVWIWNMDVRPRRYLIVSIAASGGGLRVNKTTKIKSTADLVFKSLLCKVSL